MKKLVVCTAAIALGLSASAATVDWQVAITGGSAASAYDGYTAYLVNASAWDAATISADTFSNSSIVLDSATFDAGSGKGSKTYTTLDQSNAKAPRSIALSDSVVAESGSLNVYYVILNTNADPDSYYTISDTLTGRGATGETTLGSNTVVANSTLAGATWTPVGGSTPTPTPDPTPSGGAPEPTSGLLLLVGGAMLALRRKQK